MPFIGKQPAHGNRTLLDSITTSATATYALQKSSTTFTAASAESLIVSLNGVIQAPINAYTLASNNTQIVFASALTSNDVIDFIISVSDAALPIGTPSDSTVTSAKIVDDSVTVDKLAAGTLKTPSSYSIAIGTNALIDGSLSGSYNVAVGVSSLKENENGAYNCALGASTLKAQTSASYNTAAGYAAGAAISTGGYNCLYGYLSGNDLTDGVSNNLIGAFSAEAATSASYTNAHGYAALYKLTTGNHNSAFGQQSLHENTTGHSNSGFGNYSLYGNTEGFLGTAVGYAALYGNTEGDYNTAVGVQAGYTNSTGYNQVFLGGYAGYAATTGNSNLCAGYTSGYGITTGSNNICVGTSSGRAASPSGNITTASNYVCIGDNSITNAYIKVGWTTGSDERDKAEITDFTHGLSWINKMRPVTYKWDMRSDYLEKDAEDDEDQDITKVTRDGSKKTSKIHIGLIAQEVLEIENADNFATTTDNELLVSSNADRTAIGLQYERVVPVLINAIKELEARIKVLEG